ncbi:hypothetical protein [Luteimicrobium subarcticum]|uniref:Uncharacterized protein n=1 Tax=Luteimicrobium subarcticum TaxID=620910 RepID=A0A2M8WR49_9MICO|nr:hypothetical protein [Luteimicrobium subarcticum]PJI93388.1 hypothetical protein CLV34_1957 [Luteimicrobium subarcticum]
MTVPGTPEQPRQPDPQQPQQPNPYDPQAAPQAPQDGPPAAPQYGQPGPAPYGGMPTAPQYAATPAGPPVAAPPSITLAVRLMFVGAALSLVGIILAWATKDALRDQLRDASSSSSLTPSELDTLLNVSLAVATVVGLIGVGLWIWMALANGAGKSWARIVSTVLGALSVVTTLVNLTRESGASMALSVVSIALAVVILVLLWRRESSEFYAARSAKL